MKEILLIRMYVGKFLEANIGHEVINLFKDDNGSNYLYVNPYGQLHKKHNDIESILLVRGINAKTIEVIAKAVHPIPILDNALPRDSAKAIQIEYITKNHITYGGVPLHQIFQNNEGNETLQVAYISFKTENIFYPKQKMYLTTDENAKLYGKLFFLPQTTFPKQSLHWTYGDGSKAHRIISKILNDKKLWQNENITQKISDITEHRSEDDFNGHL